MASQDNLLLEKQNKPILICTIYTQTGSEDDLEYYVRECGNILGVTQKLDSEAQSAKHVLSFIFDRIVEFKKFNQVN